MPGTGEEQQVKRSSKILFIVSCVVIVLTILISVLLDALEISHIEGFLVSVGLLASAVLLYYLSGDARYYYKLRYLQIPPNKRLVFVAIAMALIFAPGAIVAFRRGEGEWEALIPITVAVIVVLVVFLLPRIDKQDRLGSYIEKVEQRQRDLNKIVEQGQREMNKIGRIYIEEELAEEEARKENGTTPS